jgi:hypothetical protein
MMFFLKFMCTPMKLTLLKDLRNKTKSKEEAGKEQMIEDIKDPIFSVMDQMEPILSALPSSLLNEINNIYIWCLSKQIGFIGSPDRSKQYANYQEGLAQYVQEVELEKKVKSVVKDAAYSGDLGLVNDHLVIKWQWIQFGLFDVAKWLTSTGVPLVMQMIIGHLDKLFTAIEGGFEEVCKTLQVEIYVVCHFSWFTWPIGNLSGLKGPETGNTDEVGMLLTGEPGTEYRTELYMRTKYGC